MDVNAAIKKLQKLQNVTSTAKNIWKPTGKSTVRIVPYKFNKDNPFLELYFHYNLGDNKTHLSPVSYGRPDPIQEYADKLKATGEKQDFVEGRKLEPKMRTFLPIVERGKEDEGVKFWGFGKTVYTELLGTIADPEYGDITRIEEGRDINIEKQTPQQANNQYGKVLIRVSPRVSPLHEDATVTKSLLEDQLDINDVYEEPSYDELDRLFKNLISPEDDDSNGSNGESTESHAEPAGDVETTQPAQATTDPTEVGDAFEQAFGSK